ncbi:hypothetical protein FSP39_004773 [Pinctada imbricata]|uniref:Non-homologous end-joining factor 1 n=1 Tax=Pinctada imbricata TaxID=66713 RepID=A0AA88YIG0_PINIB|nr:hypothetical protein FSP39_004773 [Pinctada imbricata]
MSNEIEWRRKWKPDLKSLPWQPIKIDDKQYLIKCRFTVNTYELLITDMKRFWHEEISETQLKKRVQKLNPSIEADVTRILDQIQSCIDNPGRETTLSLSYRDDNETGELKMVLKVNSQLAGMPFSWNFVASRAENDTASENLIIPLLAMVGELSRRQRELVKIIAAKDKEIDDYKSQGVRTSRKHIETQDFVPTAFENDMLTSKEFADEVRDLGKSGFSEESQDLYRQIMTKHAWVNRSPKKEDNTADEFLDSESLRDGKRASSGPSWGSNRLPPSIGDSKSPKKSPDKSPWKGSSSTETSPVKDSELLRRQALERKLEDEERKKQEPKKKKKKIAF